jgi:hypothetical protein
MGNINCCEETKKIDKDFDVENIFSTVKNKELKNSPRKKITINESESNKNQEEIDLRLNTYKNLVIINFNPLLNSNLLDNSIQNYKNKKDESLNLMKLIKHASFRDVQNNFSQLFIEHINKARTDFLGFSKLLIEHYNNFDYIQNKINQINDVNLINKIFRSKENFKEASNFFNELYEKNIKENKINLTDLIEIDEIKVPIPLDKKELSKNKYYKKFRRRLRSKYKEKFRIGQIITSICSDEIDISFLLFISKEFKSFSSLIDEKMKYIAIDFEENKNKTYYFTIILASDY